MGLEIIRGTSQKPASSRELVSCLSKRAELQGQLFIGFPIITTPNGSHPIDALWISGQKGIVVFDLIDGSSHKDFEQRQDDLVIGLEACLKVHRGLVARRSLRIPIHVISFAPGILESSIDTGDDYPLIATCDSLIGRLESLRWDSQDEYTYVLARSVIESVSTIRKTRRRQSASRPDSRGFKLKQLEDSIATLDPKQNKAVVETVDGVQRIRGLAGSGKTIVLALKAAYLHANHPDWRIAVTFHTRSLKGHFRNLINTFCLEKGIDPDWENIRVVNAWGAPGGYDRDGIYYEFCRIHGLKHFDFRAARSAFGSGNEFLGACTHALENATTGQQVYDAILVDEAQDLPPEFLRLCFALLKDPKRLVYAYDELQNLSGSSLPAPEEIFGSNANGAPRVSFESGENDGPLPDIILDTCYRNSRPVLVTAHALGFGTYRDANPVSGTGLIQMFDHPQLWEEIGYSLKEGKLEEGSRVALCRTVDTSPKFLEEHSSNDDLVMFGCFENEGQQAMWLAEEIKKNLEKDELRYDDIIVINPDPITTRKKTGLARSLLLQQSISCHLAGVDTSPDIFFFGGDSITFTGIYRAKGNEAGMVYIINAQDCNSSTRYLARIRNQLFTAITRSKAWVRVLGVGDGMRALMTEYQRLKSLDFELHFSYPTQDQREKLRIVHRDMTRGELKKVENSNQFLNDLVVGLQTGEIQPEDLNEDLLVRLKQLLEKH